jgi:hypothetical protein
VSTTNPLAGWSRRRRSGSRPHQPCNLPVQLPGAPLAEPDRLPSGAHPRLQLARDAQRRAPAARIILVLHSQCLIQPPLAAHAQRHRQARRGGATFQGGAAPTAAPPAAGWHAGHDGAPLHDGAGAARGLAAAGGVPTAPGGHRCDHCDRTSISPRRSMKSSDTLATAVGPSCALQLQAAV